MISAIRAFFVTSILPFFMGTLSMAKSTEEMIFEKPPYLTAAKAISAGDNATLERLIKEGLDVNYEGRETNTPWGEDSVTLLLWAELRENISAMESLLKAGANVNKGTQAGLTPLIDASIKKRGDLFEMLLVKYNANPNSILDLGVRDSALTVVLEEKDLGDERWRRAEMLLKHGADVNLDLDRGATAVISMTHFRNWQAVLWLLGHGANCEARDKIDSTMMGYLRMSYQTHQSFAHPEDTIYRDKVRDWLLAHGVERSRVDPTLPLDPKYKD